MTRVAHNSGILQRIVGGGDDCVPRKYQNGKLQVRRDVLRPYYFVRITVPILTPEGRKKQRKQQAIGFLDEISKKQAQKLRAELLEQVNAGKMLASAQDKFRFLAEQFIAVRLPQLGVAKQAGYRSMIERHILPAFGEMKMCDIDAMAVEAWLTSKADTMSWWSRISLKGCLSAIFTAARRWKRWEGDNPTSNVRCGKKKLAREKKLLTTEQLRALLAALSLHLRLMVLALYATGLRISELLGLKWRDIDLDAETLTVNRRWYRGDLSDEVKSENSQGRVLQIGPLADEFRRIYPGPQERDCFVFVGDDGLNPPDERDMLRYELRPVLKRLGLYVTGFGWHGFRRANVTHRQTIGGATPLEAQKAAGHGSVDMVLLYTLGDAEREKGQVRLMLDKLVGEGGKPQ